MTTLLVTVVQNYNSELVHLRLQQPKISSSAHDLCFFLDVTICLVLCVITGVILCIFHLLHYIAFSWPCLIQHPDTLQMRLCLLCNAFVLLLYFANPKICRHSLQDFHKQCLQLVYYNSRVMNHSVRFFTLAATCVSQCGFFSFQHCDGGTL